MRLPFALEVPGVLRVRVSAELDGRPVEMDVDSGRARLVVSGNEWARLVLAPGRMVLDLDRHAAGRLFREAGRSVGWLWLMRRSPGFMRAMQSLADQAETEVVFAVGGHPLVTFTPGQRPSFNPGGLRGFWS